MTDTSSLLADFNKNLANSGCVKCSARHPERTQIPRGFFVNGSMGGSPVVVVLSYPRESDELAGRLLSGAEKNTFKRWLGDAYSNLYITAAVKCRIINDREPHKKEITTCASEYLKYEIGALKPKIVIAMGKIAIKGLFGVSDKEAGTMLNRVFDRNLQDDQGIFWSGKIYTTYHPGFFEMGGGHAVTEEEHCISVLQQAFKDNNNE
jgi:uracil-DNA glycosylase family 4